MFYHYYQILATGFVIIFYNLGHRQPGDVRCVPEQGNLLSRKAIIPFDSQLVVAVFVILCNHRNVMQNVL